MNGKLRVAAGGAANDVRMQLQADILGVTIGYILIGRGLLQGSR